MFVSTVGNDQARTNAASDVPLTGDEAVKLICMIAPPIDKSYYSESDLGFYKECQDDGDFDSVDSMIALALQTMDEKNNAITKSALKRAAQELEEDIFRQAVFRFVSDYYRECDKIGSTEAKNAPPNSIVATPGKHFISRLKRIKKASRVLRRQASVSGSRA